MANCLFIDGFLSNEIIEIPFSHHGQSYFIPNQSLSVGMVIDRAYQIMVYQHKSREKFLIATEKNSMPNNLDDLIKKRNHKPFCS
ncbi:hypothetical protein QMZ30_03075 [Pantoea sp. EA-12]|uniref:hypothetical protein n=1 Tax=Pantoea sp. EA-12 TaxID=3043303 RepID=UPI0024B58F90|nr:hypothetical protein [Pantoea sp. EA-12]MDI9219881.1 hypothetical protein [Pantoea sp. EA-12]